MQNISHYGARLRRTSINCISPLIRWPRSGLDESIALVSPSSRWRKSHYFIVPWPKPEINYRYNSIPTMHLVSWMRLRFLLYFMLVDYGVMAGAHYNFRHFIINDESCYSLFYISECLLIEVSAASIEEKVRFLNKTNKIVFSDASSTSSTRRLHRIMIEMYLKRILQIHDLVRASR